jgi:lipopolysaccharide/colanic/teichoic acid biosynthesis glycosyltransferase
VARAIAPMETSPVSVELEISSRAPARSATSAGPPSPPRPRRFPWRRPEEEWERLAPRGVYAERVRTPFLLGVTLYLVPLALVLALPIALVNACVHGPRRILFAQARAGWRGRPFVLLKFRTMRDPVAGAGDEARVTRFGRFLRNTHLDELPQLWNVLRGEMCLVGPRPETLQAETWAERHCPGFSARLALRPGLTGHAQVTQGYTQDGDVESYREKLALNRAYLEALSFAGDGAILLRTVAWMLRARGWRVRQLASARP